MIQKAAAPKTYPDWLVTAMPLASFIVLGMPAGALGVAWPPMRATFGAPLAGLGFILAAVTASYFTGSALSGPLARRFGGTSLWIAGCAFDGTALLAMAVTPTWWLLLPLGLLAGAGFGLIDAAVNAQVSLTRGVRYMGWLHACWAFGAAIGPQIVVFALSLTASWRPALAVVGGAFLATGAVVGTQRRANEERPLSAGQVESLVGRAANYRATIALLAFLLFLGAGLEASTGDWSFTQLTIGRGLSAVAAGVAASLFWLGLAGGRVGLGLLGNRASAMRLLDVSLITALIAALLYWLSPVSISAFIALPLLGIAVSLIWPLLLSDVPARVGSAMTGHAVGYGIAAGTLGGGGIPALMGLVLQGLGLRTLGPMLAAVAAGLVGLHLAGHRGLKR